MWCILVRNPADAVDPPKMRALDAAETATLLAFFRPTRIFVPVVLGVLCGLRRGEVTALRWRAVDLKAGHLTVVEGT